MEAASQRERGQAWGQAFPAGPGPGGKAGMPLRGMNPAGGGAQGPRAFIEDLMTSQVGSFLSYVGG